MGNSLGKTREKRKFFMVFDDWFHSPSFRDLSCPARCLYFEFLKIYHPSKNGELSISTRNAKKLLRVCENTAIKAFDELVEHGFLILINYHNWTQRKAREYELTTEKKGDRQPSNLWQSWELGKPVNSLPKKNPRPQIVGQSASECWAVCFRMWGSSASKCWAEVILL